MNRSHKIGLGVVGALVVIVGVVVVVLSSSLDSIVETAVEQIGSEVTKTRVRLDSAEISPTSGAGALYGLTVGNPAGFETANAFALGEISISLDIDTLAGDTIVIREIVIAEPRVTYEIGLGGSNIDAIKKNVDVFAGGGEGGAKEGSAGGDDGVKLVIEDLYIRSGRVDISGTALGGKVLSVPLPDLHLEDIGKAEGGASAGEVIRRIFSAVTEGIGKSVGTLDLEGVLGAVEGAAKGTIDAVSEAAEGAKGVGEMVGGAVKGLFGDDE